MKIPWRVVGYVAGTGYVWKGYALHSGQAKAIMANMLSKRLGRKAFVLFDSVREIPQHELGLSETLVVLGK